jgi:hypothetical protein
MLLKMPLFSINLTFPLPCCGRGGACVGQFFWIPPSPSLSKYLSGLCFTLALADRYVPSCIRYVGWTAAVYLLI